MKRPKITQKLHASKQEPKDVHGPSGRRFAQVGVRLALRTLGYSNPYSLGQAVLNAAIEQAEIAAQHSTCKTLFLDRKPVEQEHQHLTPAEIRKIRWDRGDDPVEVKCRNIHKSTTCWQCGSAIPHGESILWIMGTGLARCHPACSQ